MSNTLYKMINPIVKGLLGSPFHGILSKNTLVIEFRGRKTGRSLATPVSYHIKEGRLHCFTNKQFQWWRNLVGAQKVGLRLRGDKIAGKPTVIFDEPEIIQAALTDFLVAVPRDAAHAGVTLDENRRPVAGDVAEAAKGMVYISIDLSD